jgi:hypothetical protein
LSKAKNIDNKYRKNRKKVIWKQCKTQRLNEDCRSKTTSICYVACVNGLNIPFVSKHPQNLKHVTCCYLGDINLKMTRWDLRRMAKQHLSTSLNIYNKIR